MASPDFGLFWRPVDGPVNATSSVEMASCRGPMGYPLPRRQGAIWCNQPQSTAIWCNDGATKWGLENHEWTRMGRSVFTTDFTDWFPAARSASLRVRPLHGLAGRREAAGCGQNWAWWFSLVPGGSMPASSCLSLGLLPRRVFCFKYTCRSDLCQMEKNEIKKRTRTGFQGFSAPPFNLRT